MFPRFHAGKEIPDAPGVRRYASASAMLSVAAFWAGMVAAARGYPSGYDWRYMPASNLVSSGDNPSGYLYSSAGIVVCGLFGLYWASAVARLPNHGGERPRGAGALRFGYFFMMLSAVLPQWLPRIRKGHEILAALAFAGLLVGIVRLTFRTVERILQRRMERSGGRDRLCAYLAAGSAVSPILLAGLAQAYFYYVPPEYHWAGFSWQVRGWPVVLRFPFWEWITCAVLSVYMVVLTAAAHADSSARKSGENGGSDR